MAVMRLPVAIVGPGPDADRRRTLASLRGQVRAVLGPGEVDLPGDAEALLVVPAGVSLARGAVRRLSRRAAGRRLVRVFLPGLERPLAWWDAGLVREAGLSPGRLVAAGPELERELLDPQDGRARAWVPADEVGASTRGGGAWAWRTGAALALRAAVAPLRSRAGQVKRARALRRQREQVARRGGR